MTSQEDLAYRLARGDPLPLPAASNVRAEPVEGSDEFELLEVDGDAYRVEAWLVGYHWAAYAARLAGGSVVVFGGWRGYSPSTDQQLSEIERGFRRALDMEDIHVADARYQVRPESEAERDADQRIEKHQNDYPA